MDYGTLRVFSKHRDSLCASEVDAVHRQYYLRNKGRLMTSLFEAAHWGMTESGNETTPAPRSICMRGRVLDGHSRAEELDV